MTQTMPSRVLSTTHHTPHPQRRGACIRCMATTTTTTPNLFRAPPQTTTVPLQYSAATNTLTTTAPIKPRATVFEVPASAWLTVSTVAVSPIGSAVQGLEPWLQLALYLIHTGDMLGEQPNVPLLWDDADKALLAGSQLEASMQGYAAFFQAKHEQLTETVYKEHPVLFNSNTFTASALVRAACAVRAATFPPLEGERIALVPGVGPLAHRRRDAGVLTVKAGGLFGSGGDKVVYEAGEGGIPEGGVLALDLSREGARVDSQMVLDYGTRVFGAVGGDFKDAARHANPGYVLTLAIPESDPFVDDKVDIVNVNKLDQSESFTLTPTDPPPPDMLAFLRLLNLNGADAFLLEALFRNEVWDHLQDPISEENERAICEGMVAGCREALLGYTTTIDEDLALLRGGVGSPEVLAAVLVRLGEKEAIDAALQWFEGRLEQLGRLEYYAERRLKRLGLLDDSGRTTYDSFFEDGIA